MSYLAINLLYNLNNSNLEVTTDNEAAGVSGVPNTVDTGVLVIDSTNYQYYRR